MHFHLPKPLHGWREFAGEVGIIVSASIEVYRLDGRSLASGFDPKQTLVDRKG